LGGGTPDPMNGRCKPPEQGSGQKNRNLAQLFFVKDVLFVHLWRGYRPLLPLPGYAYGLSTVECQLIASMSFDFFARDLHMLHCPRALTFASARLSCYYCLRQEIL